MHRALSVIGASALALTGVLVMGGTAASASPGDIVAPQDGGSIIVHKHSGVPGSAGTGQEITGDAAAALGMGVSDVPFKLERVYLNGAAIDLSDPAAWNNLPTTPAQAGTAPFSLVEVDSGDTDASGMLTFSGLGLGLYVVTELDGGPDSIVEDMADPFLVSVPHRGIDDSTWNYNVHVYPKNLLKDNPTKTVSEPDGNNVTWTITTTVPRPPSGSVYTSFTITDVLDDKLEYVSATVTRDGTPLPASVVGVSGQTVTVTIPPGEVRTGQVYVVNIVTEVLDAGAIVNNAVRNVNGVERTIGPAQTNWGKVQVLKKESGTNATLQGAKFELWTGEDDPDDRTKVFDEQTTGSTGLLTFDHVWLGNGADTTERYCLKETQAPAGHSIEQEWTCVTLNAADTGVVQQPIFNPKRTTPNLPLTGSTGTVAFMAGGLSLMLLAGGAALLATRRRRAQLGEAHGTRIDGSPLD